MDAPTTLEPGSRLEGYEIASRLGTGGMGEVYLARDLRLGRRVAIKVLLKEHAADVELLDRLEREARAASALNHPSIVHIYAVGASEGLHYIVMEHVEGETLRRRLAGGALPLRQTLELGAQIAEGLAKAHQAGIVHRDLKPENVMVTPDGFAKVLDFGLAKRLPPELGQLTTLSTVGLATRPGTLLGTFEYMAPEQARGEPVDHRADQFALGALLYEMLTGRIAFRRPTAAQTLAAVMERDPEETERLGPGLPAPLATLVRRCLAKEPAGRYAATSEVAAALKGLAAQAMSGTMPPLAPASTHVPASSLAPTAVPAPAPTRVVPELRSFHVQTERRVVVLEEAELRKSLRRHKLTGAELVRMEGDDGWRPLWETAVFRDEVPFSGEPSRAAMTRLLRGLGGHCMGFAVTAYVMVSTGHGLPWWLGFWLIGLAGHAGRVVPSVIALARERRLASERLAAGTTGAGEAAGTSPRALPPVAASVAIASAVAPVPSPPVPLPVADGVAAEVTRIRALLAQRGGRDRDRLVAEVDRLHEVIAELAQKARDLEDQTSEEERSRLQRSQVEARARLETADLEQDRQLFARQVGVLGERLLTIEKALKVLDRLHVRRDLAEHQLKQLRLDLTRDEVAGLDVPELSSRLAFIRHDVDAREEVDEILARSR